MINDVYESNDYNKIQIFAPISELSDSSNSNNDYPKPLSSKIPIESNQTRTKNIPSNSNNDANPSDESKLPLSGITDQI